MSDRTRRQQRSSSTPPSRGGDLLVVGAGVIGLSVAWRAARAGMEVTVLDSAGAGAGTSAVAAGMLAPVGEASWGEEALLGACRESAAMYPGFAVELEAESGIDPGYRRCGALHVAADRDEAAELRRRFELYAALGAGAQWIDRRACRELEPALAPSAGPGVLAPGEGEIDPREMLRGLIAACRARGVDLREHDAASGLLGRGDAVGGARTEAGEELRAARTVIATGPRAGQRSLAPEVELPVRPVKGELLRLRGPAGGLPCERLIVTERVYMVPRRSGELVVGATSEERGFETTVSAGGALELLREAYRIVPEIAELELVEAGAGLRPGTPDNLPIVGAAAGRQGLLVAVGHYRSGILLAPLTAEAVVALATDQPPPETVVPMTPQRFARPPAEAVR